MTQLLRPQEQVLGGPTRLSPTNAGQSQVQGGEFIEALGKKYFEESRQSIQATAYSNAITQATTEYSKAAKERMSTNVDENGNPSYESLVGDIKSIGKNIKAKAARFIVDPFVKNKFNEAFTRLDQEQQLQAFSTARKQQMDFSLASLSENLRVRQQEATQVNPDQLKMYEDQTWTDLTTAMESGLITAQQRTNMMTSFAGSVRTEAYRNIMEAHPEEALGLLKNTSLEQLNLDKTQQRRLIREAEITIAEKEAEAARRRALAEKAYNDEIRQTVTSFEVLIAEQKAGIREESFSLKDLEAVREKIGEKNYKDILNKHTAAQRKQEKSLTNVQKLSKALANGEDLTDFSSGTIDKHFNEVVSSFDGDLSLLESAGLAAGYNQPVRNLSKKANVSILNGSPEQVEDALNAYIASRDRGSRALEHSAFSRDAEEIAEYAELLIDQGGLEVREAIQIARDKVFDKTPEVSKVREKEFKEITDFQLTDKIMSTINDELDLNWPILGGLFGVGNQELAPEVLETYKKFARESYLRTGDEDAAKKAATNRMAKTHGTSNVNGREVFMFAPPEDQVFNGAKLSSGQITYLLHNDVKDILPEGVTKESLRLAADRMTKGYFVQVDAGRKQEVINYSIYYPKTLTDGTVVEMPLINPTTGEIVRWTPTITQADVKQEKKEFKDALEAAKETRDMIQDKYVPPNLPGLKENPLMH